MLRLGSVPAGYRLNYRTGYSTYQWVREQSHAAANYSRGELNDTVLQVHTGQLTVIAPFWVQGSSESSSLSDGAVAGYTIAAFLVAAIMCMCYRRRVVKGKRSRDRTIPLMEIVPQTTRTPVYQRLPPPWQSSSDRMAAT